MRTVLPIVLLLTVALLSLPLIADPSDYARGRVLDAGDRSVVQRLAVPDDVYEWAVRSDLGDLRVFNRSQEEVPYSLRHPQRTEEFSPWETIPSFAVPSVKSGTPADDRVRVEVSPAGAIIAYSGGRESAGTTTKTYLLDASALGFVPSEMRLRWADSQADEFVGSVRLEISDDLDSWQTLVEATTVARLSGGSAGEQPGIQVDRIEIPRREGRYLRIVQIEGSASLAIEKVEVRQRLLELPQRRWRALEGSAVDGGWEFASDGWFPVDRLQVSEPGTKNYLVVAHLYSRGNSEEAWRDRGLRTFYRSSIGHEVVESEPLAIDDGGRHWRVEFEGEGISVPVLNVGWLPDEVVFLKQGSAPYVLAYGRADTAGRQWPLTELLRRLNGGSGKIELADVPIAKIADAQMLGGPDRLVSAPESIDWQTVILWLVLLSGVLLVGSMAFRLLKN